MTDPEERDATVHGETVGARAYALQPSILVTVHMWLTWAELAIEHEQEALAARQIMLDLHAKGQNFAMEMGRETGESLLAICSAAFSMDALVGVWARLVMDPQTVSKWESPGARINMGNQTDQVLRRVCKGAKTAKELTDRWRVVFSQRGGAVHFSEVPGPTAPHPSGITNAAEVHSTYSPETAKAAVDLLIETLNEVESASKPKLANWINDMACPMTALRTKRRLSQS
jgi:hypothetical protein